MDKKEMLAFIAANRIGYLATVDGDRPRVRPMGVFKADESGIIFVTEYTKDVCQQMLANPGIEVCYFADGTQVRVSGRVEEVKDEALKREMLESHPVLKDSEDREQALEVMAVFCLKPVEATAMRHMGVKTPVDL